MWKENFSIGSTHKETISVSLTYTKRNFFTWLATWKTYIFFWKRKCLISLAPWGFCTHCTTWWHLYSAVNPPWRSSGQLSAPGKPTLDPIQGLGQGHGLENQHRKAFNGKPIQKRSIDFEMREMELQKCHLIGLIPAALFLVVWVHFLLKNSTTNKVPPAPWKTHWISWFCFLIKSGNFFYLEAAAAAEKGQFALAGTQHSSNSALKRGWYLKNEREWSSKLKAAGIRS